MPRLTEEQIAKRRRTRALEAERNNIRAAYGSKLWPVYDWFRHEGRYDRAELERRAGCVYRNGGIVVEDEEKFNSFTPPARKPGCQYDAWSPEVARIVRAS